jgi:hypothetical protein
MDKQSANIFPIPICGYKLDSVVNNISNIIDYIDKTESVNAGEYGSFTVDQNILEKEIFSPVRKEIAKCLLDYTSTLKHNVQGIKIVSSWANKLEQKEHIQPHSHSNAYVCGVIHLSTGGDLMFRKPDIADMFTLVSEYEKHDDMFFKIPAFAGQLVLFPSKIIHSVLSHNNAFSRYSIAFNTWPTKYGVPTGMVDLNNR